MADRAPMIRVPPDLATTCHVVVDEQTRAVCGKPAVVSVGTQLDWLSEHERLAETLDLDIGICGAHAERLIGWWRAR